jgi:hypothetical protein
MRRKGTAWCRQSALNWFPYHRGSCFTFFLVFQAAEGEKEVQRILDSVRYVDHPPPR